MQEIRALRVLHHRFVYHGFDFFCRLHASVAWLWQLITAGAVLFALGIYKTILIAEGVTAFVVMAFRSAPVTVSIVGLLNAALIAAL